MDLYRAHTDVRARLTHVDIDAAMQVRVMTSDEAGAGLTLAVVSIPSGALSKSILRAMRRVLTHAAKEQRP